MFIREEQDACRERHGSYNTRYMCGTRAQKSPGTGCVGREGFTGPRIPHTALQFHKGVCLSSSVSPLRLRKLTGGIFLLHICVFLLHVSLSICPSLHLCVETQQSRHSQRLYRTTLQRWTRWPQPAVTAFSLMGMLHDLNAAAVTSGICFAMMHRGFHFNTQCNKSLCK